MRKRAARRVAISRYDGASGSGLGFIFLGLGALALGLFAFSKTKVGKTVTTTVKQAVGWAPDFWRAVNEELPELSTTAKLMIFGHAAFESGWGTASAATHVFNPFNTTAGATGSTVLKNYLARGGKVWGEANADWEFYTDANGVQQKKRISQNWRQFSSWRESVRDFWDNWIQRSDYKKVKAALLAGDVPAYAQALYDVHYFTLPPGEYTTALSGVMRIAKKLLGV